MTSPYALADDPRRGPLAARFNLRVAMEAFRRLESASFKETTHAWYLYVSSTILFARAAIDALRAADGVHNQLIAEEWRRIFSAEARLHPVFVEVLDRERDLLSHGQIGVALHPFWPLDTVDRHGGIEAIFDDGPPLWPDGHFTGQSVDLVLETTLKQVGRWIDAVDANASRRAPPRVVPDGQFEGT